MIQLPVIPPWAGLHPLIVHFPIALLLITPMLVIVGALLRPERGRIILYTALGLMLIGTLGTFLAAATGEAAGKLAERTPQIDAVLERHEELADATANDAIRVSIESADLIHAHPVAVVAVAIVLKVEPDARAHVHATRR